MTKFSHGFYKHDETQLTARGRRDARNLLKRLNRHSNVKPDIKSLAEPGKLSKNAGEILQRLKKERHK